MMKDEQCEKMLERWAAQEQDAAPQLRPKQEMYHLLRAKRRMPFFSGFVRWATVAAATACVLLVVMLHRPDVFQAPTEQQQATAQKKPASLEEPQRHEKSLNDTEGKIGISLPQKSEWSRRASPDLITGSKEKAILPASPQDAPPDGERRQARFLQQKVAPSPTLFAAKSRSLTEGRTSRTLSQRDKNMAASMEQKTDADNLNEFAAAPEPAMREEDESEEKTVGLKTFRLEQGIWIDAEHTDAHTIMAIKRDSLAFRDVLKLRPDIKPYTKIGAQVLVNIGEYSIQIGESGETSLTESDLQKIDPR